MERGKEVVLDASVVVKWFIPEAHEREALRFRGKHVNGSVTIVAPSLLIYEVVNALRYSPVLTLRDLKESVDSLYGIHLKLLDVNRELSKKALENAIKYDITFYDSVYLALAEKLGVKFVTADEGLWSKTKGNPQIKYLATI